MINRLFSGYITLSLMLLPGLILGCSRGVKPPQRDAVVKGTVSLGDKPVGPLKLNFMSVQHGNVASTLVDGQGTFEVLEPIPTGHYILYFGNSEQGPHPTNVPQRYFSDTGTDQKFEFVPGENEIRISLKP